MRELFEILQDVGARLQEQNRRIAGSVMRGKVTDVDAAKKLVRIEIGKDDDGNLVKSPWVPYKQVAGALKVHSPPSVGQVMGVHSESGDIEQGVAEPYWWNDENPSPSDSGDEHKLTFGNVTVTLIGEGLHIAVGGFSVTLSAAGADFNGGYVRSEGRAIDHTHRHTGVTPGGGLTGEPE